MKPRHAQMVKLMKMFDCHSYMEVGVKQGRMICDVVRATGITRAYAVDAWAAYDEVDEYEWDFEKIKADYDANVAQLPQITTIQNWSIEAATDFTDDPVDMIFIDAGHTYEDVVLDIPAWLPHCNKVISGHDYNPARFPGVCRAVDEHFPDRGLVNNFIWFKPL